MPPAALDPNASSALETIRTAPLTFGSWGNLKRLYKELEGETNPPAAHCDALAALIARFDAAPMVQNRYTPVAEVSRTGRNFTIASFDVQNHRGLFLINGGGGTALQTADFDVPNRLKPRLGTPLKASSQTGWLDAVWAGPTLAALRAMNDQIQIVDVSDFSAPRLRGVFGGKTLGLVVKNPLSGLASLAGSDGFLYAACNHKTDDGFVVISLANPDAPQIVGTLGIPGASRVCVVPGTSLIAVLGSGPLPESLLSLVLSRVGLQTPKGSAEQRHLHLVDVSRPDKPALVSSFPIAHDDVLAADERFVYVPDNLTRKRYEGNHGVNVFDISDPSNPRLLSRVPLGTYYTVKAIACYNGFVYAAPEYSYIKVIDARKPEEPKLLRDLTTGYTNSLLRDADTLYVGTYGGPQLLHLGEGAEGSPSAYGTPPTAQTLGYMKRRARRYLHQLARNNPAQFTGTAARFFTEPGSQAFAPAYQWVAADLLFGGGKQFAQLSHGRGGYKEIRPRGWSIRRREERFPEAWDAHPEDAATVFAAPEAVWPAREMALRILRAGRQPIPALATGPLPALLSAPSLLLIAEGVRQAVGRAEAGGQLAPETAALAVARASAKPRGRLLRALVPAVQNDAKWGQAFADLLMTHLPTVRHKGATQRRQRALAEAFVLLFPAQITGQNLLRLAPLLLETRRPDVYAPILEGAKREGASDLLIWLDVLERVSDDIVRESLLSALAQSVQGKTISETFYNHILWSPVQSAWLWRLIRASRVDTGALHSLWVILLSDPAFETALQTAMTSPDALALLGQAQISDTEMAGYLEARPEIVHLLTPEAFARLTQTLPAPLILRLAAAASDAVWQKLREGWLRNLREGVGLLELWTSAADALKNDATGNLEPRLISDPDVSATFGDVTDIAAILEIREPSFGTLLGAYFARYQEQITASDPLFLQAATHALPEVRTPALALLPARTIGLPLALGLLESRVPASVGAGRAWFDAASDVPLLVRALALCDSPAATVRGIGREFVEKHRDDLPLDELSAALAEHSDPLMQAFVARLLGNEPAPQFDREILRTRYQSRRAKEIVKTRQEMQPAAGGGAVDVETLLALARGSSTPRDADWALSQLVKRALAGETIDGLVLDESAPAAAAAKER